MKHITLKSLLFLMFAWISSCSDLSDHESSPKDLDFGQKYFRGERTFIANVSFETAALEFELNEPLTEVPKNTIRDILHNEVEDEQHCLQIVAVENSVILEVFPFACPNGGWVKDQTRISFYSLVDAPVEEILKNESGSLSLTKLGFPIGVIEKVQGHSSPELKLDDLFCHGFDNEDRCHLKTKYKRIVDLSVIYDRTQAPGAPKRYGYNDKGVRLECPRLESRFVTTEGSTYANICENRGFKMLICASGPSDDKFLCEADLGRIYYSLGKPAEDDLSEALKKIMPNELKFVSLDSSLFDLFSIDEVKEEVSASIVVKRQSSLSYDQALEIINKFKETIPQKLGGLVVQGADGKTYKVSEMKFQIIQDF